MNDISSKIYNLMLENNIKEEQIVSYLKNVIDDINISKYENIDINADMFYNLRNDIFFNYEFLDMDFNKSYSGKSKITTYGTKLPIIMFDIYDECTFKKNLKELLNEFETVSKVIDDFKFNVRLFSEQNFDWVIDGDNSSDIIVYNSKNESPRKFGYHSSGRKYTGIYNNDGEQIVINENYILCEVCELDRIRLLNTFKTTIDLIISKIKNAIEYEKIVKFNFIVQNNYI